MLVNIIIMKQFCNNLKISLMFPVHLGSLLILSLPSFILILSASQFMLQLLFPKIVKFLFQAIFSEQSAESFPLCFSWGNDLAHSPYLQASGYQEDRQIPLTFFLVPQGHLLSLSASSPLEKSSFVLRIANKCCSHRLPEDVLACPVMMGS